MCSSSGGQNCIIQSLVSSVGGRPVGRPPTDDTRDCIIQFWPPDDEHMCSKHVEAWNKLIIKFSSSSWLILINKYIEMHGQQNIKISLLDIIIFQLTTCFGPCSGPSSGHKSIYSRILYSMSHKIYQSKIRRDLVVVRYSSAVRD